jgi:putative thioredoxin
MQAQQAVIEVDEASFEAEVIARSRELPVVVDFWAPWCGPCRTLGPTLERLAASSGGAWLLAKVNVDENQRLAARYRVQGIPAVKAFRDGRVVDEFTGALPESRVRAWVGRLVPSPGDELVAVAAALEASDPQEAAARYRVALGSDPTNADALFGLGRLLLMQGDPEGQAALRDVPAGTPLYARAQAALSLGDFFAEAAGSQADELRARLAQGGADLEARYRLAAAEARRNQPAAALAELLAIVQRSRTFRDDGARKTMLALFALLGDTSPLVAEYRRKLANALF